MQTFTPNKISKIADSSAITKHVTNPKSWFKMYVYISHMDITWVPRTYDVALYSEYRVKIRSIRIVVGCSQITSWTLLSGHCSGLLRDVVMSTKHGNYGHSTQSRRVIKIQNEFSR